MVIETDLAWLGGIIDGEGSISAQTYIRKNGNLMIVPFICMANSDIKIINKVEEVIYSIGIDKIGKHWLKHIVNLPVCNLRVETNYRVKILINAIYPYIVGYKKHNADNILKFIELREQNLLRRNTLGQIIRNGYTKEEVILATSHRTHKLATPLEKLLNCNNIMKE